MILRKTDKEEFKYGVHYGYVKAMHWFSLGQYYTMEGETIIYECNENKFNTIAQELPFKERLKLLSSYSIDPML